MSETTTETTETTENEAPKITKEELDAAKAEVTKTKNLIAQLQDQLKAKEAESLKGTKNWEELAKLKETEATGAKSELDEWKKSMAFDKKISAVREEAIKNKIRTESLEDLEGFDFGDMVQTEITVSSNGIKKISVVGATQAVQHLKQKRPHWFQDAKTPNVNTTTTNGSAGGTGGDPGKLDAKAVSIAFAKAERTKDPKDRAEYDRLNLEFMNQRKQQQAQSRQ